MFIALIETIAYKMKKKRLPIKARIGDDILTSAKKNQQNIHVTTSEQFVLAKRFSKLLL